MTMFKTTPARTPEEYIAHLAEPRRLEIRQLHDFIQSVIPDLTPRMMAGMIGYGSYHYRYASGREGDWSVVALASHKNSISLYLSAIQDGHYLAEKYRDRFPQAKVGKSCIRFKKLADIDLNHLKQLILLAVQSPMGGQT